MNCYQHPSIPANGVCTVCGKALCRDCIRIGAKGCTCAGACETGRLPHPVPSDTRTVVKNLLTWILVLIVLMTLFQAFSGHGGH